MGPVEQAEAAEGHGDRLDSSAQRLGPAGAWRSVVAVVVVALTVLGSTAFTDDSWPFAPFRMFARAVNPDGRVVKVAFEGTTEGGEVVALDALDFGLRRAEVEGQQGPGGRLTDEQMRALFDDYNAVHPDDPLAELRFRRLGRELEDGRPTATIDEVIQAWPPPNERSDGDGGGVGDAADGEGG